MASETAKIDQNDRPTLTAVTDDANAFIKNLRVDPTTGRLLISAVLATNTFVYNEVVSGSGTTYTLAHTPASGLYSVYGMGQKLKPGAGNDYTIAGAVITTANTWAAGDIMADYQY